ncbi:MAG: response regulator [Desulfobacteraceae bacterium]
MSELTMDMNKMNILLVEDDPAVRKVTTRLLEYLKHSVVAVEGGRDAISTVRNQNNYFDLVMTDYAMPEMDGIELTMNLKRLLPNMPVILCTGADNRTDDQLMLESGVTEILPKPFTKSELGHSIRRAVER